VLLARDEADARALRDKLTRVGIDNVVGYAHNLEGLIPEMPNLVHARLHPETLSG
jgi:hypothetical protein